MKLSLSDAALTQFCRWVVILAPLFLLTGVVGNELPASLVAIMFLIHTLRTGDWGWTRALWVRIALALWAYIAIRGAFSEYPHAGLSLALPWIRFPIFAAACAYWLLPDATTQRRLAIAIAASAAFLVADTLFQYHFDVDIFGHPAIHTYDYTANITRLTGPFKKPRVGIITAWLLVPTLAMLSGLIFTRRRLLSYTLAGLFALAGILAVYLSGERMAFLLTVMGCGLVCLLNRRLWLVAPVLAILGVAGIAYINHINPEIASRQMQASHDQISSFSESPYGKLLHTGLAMAQQHPLFGVGPGNFRLVCAQPEYGPADPMRCANHTHNNYSEWLAEDGVIGLGLFLLIIAQWLCVAWRSRALLLRDVVAIGLFSMLAMRLFPVAATASQFVSWTAMPFWLFAGFLLARLTVPAPAIADNA